MSRAGSNKSNKIEKDDSEKKEKCKEEKTACIDEECKKDKIKIKNTALKSK